MSFSNKEQAQDRHRNREHCHLAVLSQGLAKKPLDLLTCMSLWDQSLLGLAYPYPLESRLAETHLEHSLGFPFSSPGILTVLLCLCASVAKKPWASTPGSYTHVTSPCSHPAKYW